MDDRAFVLIVEDNESDGHALAEALRESGHVTHTVPTGEEAIESIRRRPPDVVVTDYRLGGRLTGVDVLREAKSLAPDCEVIVITGHGSERLARDVLGPDAAARAYDYIIKPFDPQQVREKVDRAARQALTSRQNRIYREQLDRAFNFEGIIGSSEAMARVIKRIRQVAPTKISVLIVGESGTGKELVARAIHHNSDRADRPFKVANCAAFNENLLESELFGHVRGSFTGAISDRKGLFEAAHGGTLFLDEIGDMPLTMQAKLLRALEYGEIVPVGTTEPRIVDVRVLAATHRDLPDEIKKGRFRDDLYYRINQVTIRLPPLRERREDIPLLIDHFIQMANQEHGRNIRGITPEARRRLMQHEWRGNNVRELRNVIVNMVVLATRDVLDVDDLPEELRGGADIVPVTTSPFAGLSMAEMEKIHIANTLKLTGGNRERAARILGIGTRTLYRKIKEYGLS